VSDSDCKRSVLKVRNQVRGSEQGQRAHSIESGVLEPALFPRPSRGFIPVSTRGAVRTPASMGVGIKQASPSGDRKEQSKLVLVGEHARRLG
jgi:hypothetical protein